MHPSNLVNYLWADLHAAPSQLLHWLAKRPLRFIGAYCAVRLGLQHNKLTVTYNE